MRRILHVIEDLGFGGAEKLLGTLLPEMASRGYAPEVATLGRRVDLVGPLARAGIPVYSCGLASQKSALRGIAWLHGLILRRGPELVHTHLTFANLYGRVAARLAGIPIVTTYHGSDYEPEVLRGRSATARWKQEAYRIADRITSRTAYAVTVSEFVAQSIRRRLSYPRDRVTVIHNGVPSEAWRDITEAEKESHRRELGIDSNAQVVVQVGRLSPEKGQTHTLKLAHRLRHHRKLLWVLVGDGPLQSELEATITRLELQGKVVLAGGSLDVAAFLAAADVFLFPSLHEGLGIAVLEAMAAGLPVAAYNVGPLAEVIEDGVSGILVPAGDLSRLEQAVTGLLSDPGRRRAWGQAARDRVRTRFSIARTADLHAALYTLVLGTHRKPSLHSEAAGPTLAEQPTRQP